MTHVGGGAPRAKFFVAGLNAAAKPCDYCKSAAALLFCRGESAFMCIPCDAKVHPAAAVKHERVWVCEVCEQAPAAVTCKADAAALCVTCDRDIHSANPLASRHDRVPVVPFYDTAESVVIKSAAAEPDAALFATAAHGGGQSNYIHDPWLPASPIVAAKIPADAPDLKAMELFFQDSEQFLDFDTYPISSQPYSDSVVPVQSTVKPPFPARLTHDQSPENRFEIDFSGSNINYNSSSSFTPPSLTIFFIHSDLSVLGDDDFALANSTKSRKSTSSEFSCLVVVGDLSPRFCVCPTKPSKDDPEDRLLELEAPPPCACFFSKNCCLWLYRMGGGGRLPARGNSSADLLMEADPLSVGFGENTEAVGLMSSSSEDEECVGDEEFRLLVESMVIGFLKDGGGGTELGSVFRAVPFDVSLDDLQIFNSTFQTAEEHEHIKLMMCLGQKAKT